MKKFIYSSLLLLLFSSCGSFHLAEHHNLEMNEKLLPSLKPVYHFYNQEAVYFNEGYGDSDLTITTGSPYFDPFLEGLFKKDVWGAISKSGSKEYGYAVLSENYLSVDNNASWVAVGATLMFVPYLFGLPLIIQEVEIEYVLEIMDSKNQVIGRYLGTGHTKKTWNMYNYGNSGGDKLLKLNVYEQAMKQIKGQIAKDYKLLSNKLLLSGPIT